MTPHHFCLLVGWLVSRSVIILYKDLEVILLCSYGSTFLKHSMTVVVTFRSSQKCHEGVRDGCKMPFIEMFTHASKHREIVSGRELVKAENIRPGSPAGVNS